MIQNKLDQHIRQFKRRDSSRTSKGNFGNISEGEDGGSLENQDGDGNEGDVGGGGVEEGGNCGNGGGSLGGNPTTMSVARETTRKSTAA